jgi:hypothetical protein
LDGEQKAIVSATVFYDSKIGGDAPYKHWPAIPEDRHEFEISLGDDGRLRKKDMARRWSTVDESGTGIRAGSKRPPDVPGDAYSVLTRIEREHDAVPVRGNGSVVSLTEEKAQPPRIATRIGCDIGGVLTRRARTTKHTTKQPKWHDNVKTATFGCVEAVKSLVDLVGPENFYFVSKAKPPTQAKIRVWMNQIMNFWKRSGALEKNLIFCDEAIGPEGKGPIVKRLGLTHFIDDRVDILDDLLDAAVKQEKDWGGKLHALNALCDLVADRVLTERSIAERVQLAFESHGKSWSQELPERYREYLGRLVERLASLSGLQ